jgi:hypothetical protein
MPRLFAIDSGPEATRHEVDLIATRHDVEDTYLPAFRATLLEGKADSVMCAYNSLEGQPACANTKVPLMQMRWFTRIEWSCNEYSSGKKRLDWPHHRR